MGPIAHAALAYLLWTAYVRLRDGRQVTDAEFWVVIVSSQLPDLVDKPLAWTFGVLPAGRSLAHSLITLAVVLLVLWRVVPDDRRSLVSALALGVLSHDLLDTLAPLSRGELAYARYLLWPLLDLPPYDTSRSLLAELGDSLFHGPSVFELVLVSVIAVVWIADGMPGLPVRRLPKPG